MYSNYSLRSKNFYRKSCLPILASQVTDTLNISKAKNALIFSPLPIENTFFGLASRTELHVSAPKVVYSGCVSIIGN